LRVLARLRRCRALRLRPYRASVKPSGMSALSLHLRPWVGIGALACAVVGCGIFGVDFSEPPSQPKEPENATREGREGGSAFGPGASADQGRCASGEKVCNGNCVSLSDPAFGCGAPACDPCSMQLGAASCAAGACAVASCQAQTGDCDGNAQNGCETQTQTSSAHCGRCGNACRSGEVCSQGSCQTSCGAGLSQCGASCVDLNSDGAHCGDCEGLCGAPANGRGTCVDRKCSAECSVGFRACPGNTCKAESVTACGAACRQCDEPASGHGAARCTSGVCRVQCDPGYLACAAGCCLDAPATPVNACDPAQERVNEVLVAGFLKQGIIMPSRCSACSGTQCCFRRRVDGKDYCISR
jgi:hypothetical protein